jgi:hypothetical protein
MTTLREIQADLLLLEKIERNLNAVADRTAYRFGKLLIRKICQAHACVNAAECRAKLQKELQKS